MKRLTRCAALTALAGAAVMALFAPLAAATPPVKSEITFSDTGVLEDVCAFPITVGATGGGTEIDFFDNSGALARAQVHATEQSTFSANGLTVPLG